MFPIPVETLTAARVLANVLAPLIPTDALLVAPDLGGVKLAEAYARVLDRPVAVVRKLPVRACWSPTASASPAVLRLRHR
jgi:ribose-phosphate pyrophosphokinase